MTVNNVLSTSHDILAPLDELAVRQLTGISKKMPELLDTLHHSAFVGIANDLSPRKMAEVTVPLNTRLFAKLEALGWSLNGEPISLTEYVTRSLYLASVGTLFGEGCMPDTASDFSVMDDGAFKFLNGLSFLAKSPRDARARMASAIEAYIRKAWSDGYTEGAVSSVSNTLQRLKEQGISLKDASYFVVFVIWGAHSNFTQTTASALAHVVADPNLYRKIASDMRKAVSAKFPDITSLLKSNPSALNEPEFAILDSIIREALRLNSVASSARQVIEDVDLRGEDNAVYRLRKGEVVLVDVRGMHLDKTYFEEPEKFIPDRFIQYQANPRAIKQLRPFGGGKSIVRVYVV